MQTDSKKQVNDSLPDINNNNFNYSTVKEQSTDGKVPVRKGCPNQQCFCTGKCNEIIGWRDKLPNEF